MRAQAPASICCNRSRTCLTRFPVVIAMLPPPLSSELCFCPTLYALNRTLLLRLTFFAAHASRYLFLYTTNVTSNVTTESKKGCQPNIFAPSENSFGAFPSRDSANFVLRVVRIPNTGLALHVSELP